MLSSTPLCSDQGDHPDLPRIALQISEGRYFKRMHPELIQKTLRQASLIEVGADHYLIQQGSTEHPEVFILISGSLAVLSDSKFILRLETPGDIVGEMSVISSAPRSADVVTETKCQLVVFPNDAFVIDDALEAPSFYIMFSYILAEKLRITTAQSLVRKDDRVRYSQNGKVAIIDDHLTDAQIIRDVVSTEWQNAESIQVYTLQEFLKKTDEPPYDFYIIDPSTLKKRFSAKAIHNFLRPLNDLEIPLLIVSSLCKIVERREALINAGASELLTKPYSMVELRNSIRRFKVRYFQQKELDHIEQIADTDRLTGLANRRRLDEFLDALLTIYPESKQPFSLIISDVDNFKHYNDHHGHPAGDVVLSRVASIFIKNVRRGDLAARFGGEEFVMILPNCGKEAAARVAEKLRHSVEKEKFPFQNEQPGGNLTATFGVATFPEDAKSLDSLLQRADECLYEGKEAGRNVVIS